LTTLSKRSRGPSYIWNSQNFINERWNKEKIKQYLCGQYLQNWNDDRQTCSKAINYRIFKDTFFLNIRFFFIFKNGHFKNIMPMSELHRLHFLFSRSKFCHLPHSIGRLWLTGNKEKIKQYLCGQYLQNWNDDRQTCSKAINYRIFKDTFGFEDYFNILDEKDCFHILQISILSYSCRYSYKLMLTSNCMCRPVYRD
jgi:hypothetical protein